VLFKNNYEANGVEYSKFNKIFNVYALKSVVISAGALNTPKILILSGVGPANQLRSLQVIEILIFFNKC
jgi:choline dehydrogenase-like flavoprotein